MAAETVSHAAEMAHRGGVDLIAVVAVLLFRRAGLGSVLGYLAAGLAIGTFGLRFFHDAQSIIHVAELGVVLFLFIMGLEMQPSRLWAMPGEIFGLGLCRWGSPSPFLSGSALRSVIRRRRALSQAPASC